MLRPRWAAPVGVATGSLAFGAALWGWLAGGGSFDAPWAPTLGLRISLSLDGLAALYALLATGIGTLVVIYSAGYLPVYLASERRSAREGVRFYGFIMLFLGSMVGLVMAQDLLLLFVFWDLTMLTSYFLIGYDRHKAEARASAFMALLITGIPSVLFLIGSLLLFVAYGTFSIPELIAAVRPGALLTAAGMLMAVAGLAKSAQVPLHFWLPRAMVAPTPVSAYLHSAAMVAAGVFLLSRIHPLLQPSEPVLALLLSVGLLSMVIGGVLALTRDVLKQLLAYSTIAQYGYVVTMLGLGGAAGAVGASFYVLAHGMTKSALFLTAGAVTEATGEDRLSHLGGLWGSMPVLGVAAGALAAGLAGLPLTIGFFKDELFFTAMLRRGWPFAALSVLGASFTLAYIWRFWSGLFLGTAHHRVHPVSLALVGPVVFLGLATVAGGIVVGPFAALAEAAGAVTFGAPVSVELAYHLDPRPQNLMALAAYGLGALLIVSRPAWERAAQGWARLGERLGPQRWYELSLHGLALLSDRLHSLEVRDLRRRIMTILLPTGILVGASLLVVPTQAGFVVGEVRLGDLPLILALILAVVAALLTTLVRNQLALVLVLSAVGFSLAVVYAFFGAPNVALVAVLVETIFTLLFLGLLALLPRGSLRRLALAERRSTWWHDPILATIAGGFAFIVAWSALSQPAAASVAVEQIQLAPQAHFGDVVTAILTDFRALDTMGEITVIVIGLLGVVTLLQRGRLWYRRF